MKIEIEGVHFILQLDGEGDPRVLKQYRQSESGRWHHATVWAQWHIGKPTGLRARAVRAAGFVWDNSTDPCHWRKVAPASAE